MATLVKPPIAQPVNTYGGYNLSPGGAGGLGGAFGGNVAQIGAPPSIYEQLKSNVPNYAGLTSGASGDISAELNGTLSPGTQKLLQDKAAAFGVNIGMPGGTPGNTLTTQNLLDNMGLTSEGLAHQGLTDYNQFQGTLGSEQQNPELLSNIAEQNAVNAAAPNPAAASNYAQQLFDKYLNSQSAAPKTPAEELGLPNNGTFHQIPGSSAFIPGYAPM